MGNKFILKTLTGVAILSPVIGALASRMINSYPKPIYFWQGLIVQSFLLLAMYAFYCF